MVKCVSNSDERMRVQPEDERLEMANEESDFSQLSDMVNALSVASQQLKALFAQLRLEYENARDSEVSQIRYQAEIEKREVRLR